jgi:GNAT superfamily N-acetyltransferase
METRRAGYADLSGAWALMRRMVFEEFGYGWRPGWHWDIADVAALAATYCATPRQALFVAVDDAGAVQGTAAVRQDGPASPPHPDWLAARYAGPEAGQLARVWVAPEQRRRGVARGLLAAACSWASSAGYQTLCLHTDTGVPGAEPFWRAMPVVQVYDARAPGAELQTVHFELPLVAVAVG